MAESSIIDFSKFTFTAEQIRNINELTYEGIMALPELASLHQMYDGIRYDKEIGFITGGSLVGKAGQGCNPQPQEFLIGTRKVVWEPKIWEVYIEECADKLYNTMVVYALNKGTAMDDLTDTDYMAIVVEVLIDELKKMFYRIAYLSDEDALAHEVEELPTAAVSEQSGASIVGTVYEGVDADTEGAVKCAKADKTIVYLSGTAAQGAPVATKTYYTKDTSSKTEVDNGGEYTEGLDEDYFNIIKAGFFKQMRTIVASDGTVGETISANSQATKALQDSALTPQAAYNLLSAMYYKANIRLRGFLGNGLTFRVTQSIWDKYQQYLVGLGISEMYKNLVDGKPSLSFNGVPVIAMPIWDEQIRSYQDLGDTFFKPHRAILTINPVLAIGTESKGGYSYIDIFYDRKSKQNVIDIKDKIDAKVTNPKMFVYAE